MTAPPDSDSSRTASSPQLSYDCPLFIGTLAALGPRTQVYDIPLSSPSPNPFTTDHSRHVPRLRIFSSHRLCRCVCRQGVFVMFVLVSTSCLSFLHVRFTLLAYLVLLCIVVYLLRSCVVYVYVTRVPLVPPSSGDVTVFLTNAHRTTALLSSFRCVLLVLLPHGASFSLSVPLWERVPSRSLRSLSHFHLHVQASPEYMPPSPIAAAVRSTCPVSRTHSYSQVSVPLVPCTFTIRPSHPIYLSS